MKSRIIAWAFLWVIGGLVSLGQAQPKDLSAAPTESRASTECLAIHDYIQLVGKNDLENREESFRHPRRVREKAGWKSR